MKQYNGYKQSTNEYMYTCKCTKLETQQKKYTINYTILNKRLPSNHCTGIVLLQSNGKPLYSQQDTDETG